MDNYGIKPIAPPLEHPEADLEEVQLDKADVRLSNEAHDVRFPEIEEIMINEIERLSLKQNNNLPADEYKIHSLGDERARSVLISVLERIHNAVTATESAKGDN